MAFLQVAVVVVIVDFVVEFVEVVVAYYVHLESVRVADRKVKMWY